jgi:hypothetical protein
MAVLHEILLRHERISSFVTCIIVIIVIDDRRCDYSNKSGRNYYLDR